MLLNMENFSLKITVHIQTLKGTRACIVWRTTKHGWCVKYIYNLEFSHSGLKKNYGASQIGNALVRSIY